MKRIINWFRDLFYNFTDYAIILIVIVGVAGILIWRFNVLFDLKIDKDTIKPVAPPIDISENKNDDNNSEENNDTDENNNSEENKDTEGNSNTNDSNNESNPSNNDQSNQENNSDNDKDETDKDETTNVAVGTEIKFTIPAGSFPSKIADVLLANGLIEDKQVFLTRSVELGLDTKLKSGDFTIKAGTSLDEIIKIIAK